MHSSSTLAIASFAAVTLASGVALAEPFVIENGTNDLFAPSFRGGATSTHFGWLSAFDSNTADDTLAGEIITNPVPNLGAAPATWGLVQNTATDILTSSNSIYTLGPPPTMPGDVLDLTLTTSTQGATPDTGFTTIILQGRTAFGPYDADAPLQFADIGGIDPVEVVSGINSAGAGQFWVKYELPGSVASYAIGISAAQGHTSIGRMEVDAYWSADGFAADSAVVPEPASMAAVAAGGLALLVRRRRASHG